MTSTLENHIYLSKNGSNLRYPAIQLLSDIAVGVASTTYEKFLPDLMHLTAADTAHNIFHHCQGDWRELPILMKQFLNPSVSAANLGEPSQIVKEDPSEVAEMEQILKYSFRFFPMEEKQNSSETADIKEFSPEYANGLFIHVSQKLKSQTSVEFLRSMLSHLTYYKCFGQPTKNAYSTNIVTNDVIINAIAKQNQENAVAQTLIRNLNQFAEFDGKTTFITDQIRKEVLEKSGKTIVDYLRISSMFQKPERYFQILRQSIRTGTLSPGDAISVLQSLKHDTFTLFKKQRNK